MNPVFCRMCLKDHPADSLVLMFSRAANFKFLRKKTVSSLSTRASSTIFGLSSGFGKCGVSVIRVSGDASREILCRKTRQKSLPAARKALLTRIYHGRTDEMIDRGLLLWFPGPNSFTGEDTIEFHVHGGSAIIAAMYDSLAAFPDARIAEPGEFTKRAFYAGKMDLTEVEGLADLIHAETEAQRRQALRQANGQLATFYNGMRARLVKVIAGVEAYIDFAEDQDVDDGVLDGSVAEVGTLIEELKAHLNDNRRGERLRTGVRTAIVGAPNVGKSSLINLLSQRNVSIVTSIAGTTRDIVESHYDIGGYPVVLADTAGLRSKTDDIVESEGIARAKAYVESADFVVLVIDASRIDGHAIEVDSYVEQYIRSIGLDKALLGNAMVIFNKCDLVDEKLLSKLRSNQRFTLLSCENKSGLPELLATMGTHLERLCGNPGMENPTITQERHRYHLKHCLECLERYREYFAETPEAARDLAIVTHHLRAAVRSIGRITGSVETEEILDAIFSTFCIGK